MPAARCGPVPDQDAGAGLGGLDRGACTGRAETHHYDVVHRPSISGTRISVVLIAHGQSKRGNYNLF
jgi:hypothetical protein